MDPWKRIRLALSIGVIVALLAAGGAARLMRGVPEAPYGWRVPPVSYATWAPFAVGASRPAIPFTANPLERLERDFAEHDLVRARGTLRRLSGPLPLSP